MTRLHGQAALTNTSATLVVCGVKCCQPVFSKKIVHAARNIEDYDGISESLASPWQER
jgi:hypothetical protein